MIRRINFPIRNNVVQTLKCGYNRKTTKRNTPAVCAEFVTELESRHWILTCFQMTELWPLVMMSHLVNN